jgi:hypothetical protein
MADPQHKRVPFFDIAHVCHSPTVSKAAEMPAEGNGSLTSILIRNGWHCCMLVLNYMRIA